MCFTKKETPLPECGGVSRCSYCMAGPVKDHKQGIIKCFEDILDSYPRRNNFYGNTYIDALEWLEEMPELFLKNSCCITLRDNCLTQLSNIKYLRDECENSVDIRDYIVLCTIDWCMENVR
jgi:hypothetical protein